MPVLRWSVAIENRKTKSEKWLGLMAAAPLWAIVGVCCALPLGWMAWQVVSRPEVLAGVKWSGFQWGLLGRTVLYNGAVAVVATGLGLPAAIVVGRGSGWASRIIVLVLPLALLVPSIVYTYGWMQVFRMMGVNFDPAGGADVLRCVWVLAAWLWALPAAVVGMSLRLSDSQVQQQAMLDGALWRVTLRQMAGPIVASMAMVMVLAMQEFVVYERSGISVVATEIRTVFETGSVGLSSSAITGVTGGPSRAGLEQAERAAGAVATALPLLVIVAGLSLLAMWNVKGSGGENGGVGGWPKVLNAGAGATVAAGAIVLLTLAAPTVAMVVSMKRPISPVHSWAVLGPQVSGSVLIGFLTAVAGVGIAMLACVRPGRWLVGVALVSFLVGGELLAIADIRIYNRSDPWPINSLCGSEVPATVLLSPQRPQMLIPMLMTWVHNLRYDDMLEGSLLLMGVVFVLGSGSMLLAWIGMRLAGLLRRTGARSAGSAAKGAMLLAAAILLSGCGDGTQPQEVWCETGAGKGQTVYPRGICYSKLDDTFFFVDRMARIQHLDAHGNWLNDWRMQEFTRGKPIGLSIGPDGNVYVADTHYGRVMVFTPKGEWVRSLGSEGRAPGQFVYPTDVGFDSAGNVYVSEYGDNDRIQVFDAKGNYLRMFGNFGQGDGEFSRPEGMVMDGNLVYVTDSCNHRIVVFKTDGTFVRAMGGLGSGLGELRFPYGIDQDSRGHLIVAEFGNNRVQAIDKQTGKGVRTWGVAGREPGQLAYPWAVAVDKNDRIVVVDSGNNRMQVFSW
ncbi:MAG: hypothetical protein NTU53_10485 [Planctomycetota bacterium]|nr:hypothetical protein [Planctomycetota bacterium]